MTGRRSLVALGLLLLAAPAAAGTLVYPGVGACSGTLQACVDAANAGDTVELATNSPIDADVTIAKSLTLTRRSGFAPVLGTPATHRLVTVTDAGLGGGPVQMTAMHLAIMLLDNNTLPIYQR